MLCNSRPWFHISIRIWNNGIKPKVNKLSNNYSLSNIKLHFIHIEHFISTAKTTSSVNVTKSTFSYGFGHIYWRNLERKTSFFVKWSGNYRYSKLMLMIKLMLTTDNNQSQRNAFYLRSFDLCHRKKTSCIKRKS